MALRGYIDGIAGGTVVGWAYDSAVPERRLQVEVVVDGRAIGSDVACRHRGDLERRGIGDGTYGFSVPWPDGLPLGPQHAVVATIMPAGSVPLSEDYIVRDADGAAIAGVTLRPGARPDAGGAGVRAARPVRLLGEGGMLFDAPDRETLEMGLGVRPLDAGSVTRLTSRLVAQADRVRAVAGSLLVVAALPAKTRVHPERLPATMRLEAPETPGAQITAALAARDDPLAVDLAPMLRAARSRGKVVLRSRPQMTWLGAHHAARGLVGAIGARHARITPRPAPELRLDRPRMLAAPGRSAHVWLGDRLVEVELHGGLALVAETDMELDRGALRATSAPGSGRGDAAFTCDEASEAVAVIVNRAVTPADRLTRMLAEHFRRTFIAHADASLDEILEAQKPDVVIVLADDAAFFRMA